MCHLCAMVQAEEVLRVQKLGGKHVQHRFDDYARRYLVSHRQSSIYVTSKSPRSAQVLAESVTEIYFEYPFFFITF